MSWTAAALLVSVILCACALAFVARRRASSTHVLMHGCRVVGVRLARPETPVPSLWSTLIQRRHQRAVAAYLAGEWRRDVPVTQVVLERKQPARTQVRVAHGYELDFTAPARPLAQLRFQLQLATLTVSALLTALVVGRDRTAALPPHDAYAPAEPAGVGVVPRWLMNSLQTPSPIPFRTPTSTSTATGGGGYSVPGYTVPHSNVAAGGHSNSFSSHTNTPVHTNAVTAHANTDTRPVSGPF